MKELQSDTKIKELYDLAHSKFKITPVVLFYNKNDLAPHIHKTLKDYFKKRTSLTIDVSVGKKTKGYNEYITNKYSIQYNTNYAQGVDNKLIENLKKNYIDFEISLNKKKNRNISESYDFGFDNNNLLSLLKRINGTYIKPKDDIVYKINKDLIKDNEYKEDKLSNNVLSNLLVINKDNQMLKTQKKLSTIEEYEYDIKKIKKLDTKNSNITKISPLKEKREKDLESITSPIKEVSILETPFKSKTILNHLITNSIDHKTEFDNNSKIERNPIKKTSRVNLSSDPTSLSNMENKRRKK